ncbi:hypothetical protein SRHO_G00022480 [Serrasalmus rhombeus]
MTARRSERTEQSTLSFGGRKLFAKRAQQSRAESPRSFRERGEQTGGRKVRRQRQRGQTEKERFYLILPVGGSRTPSSSSSCCRTMWSSRALAFLIYGLLVHCGACSPLGYPSARLDNAGYEEGDSVADLAFDSDQIALSSPSAGDDAYTLYYPSEQRTERHADGMFNKAYRKVLGQISARKYLHSLMAKRVGGGSAMEDSTEPLSKRHSDGVFTDSYSRYRKQMAVKKYLAAVLGKSPEDLDLHQILQDIDIDALPDGDEFEAFKWNLLWQFPPDLPAL